MDSQIIDRIFGKSEYQLVPWGGTLVHQQVAGPLETFIAAASEEGLQVEVASGYRSFERQLAIWNAKAQGERPVLDKFGVVIPPGALGGESLMWAILNWSALPGTSRHHWGTDFDVWDRAAVPADYQLQLVAEEYADQGPFRQLNQWLLGNAGDPGGFFRPYSVFRGGVMPEPWHISFGPVSGQFEGLLKVELLSGLIEKTDICLKEYILENLGQIVEQYCAPACLLGRP